MQRVECVLECMNLAVQGCFIVDVQRGGGRGSDDFGDGNVVYGDFTSVQYDAEGGKDGLVGSSHQL